MTVEEELSKEWNIIIVPGITKEELLDKLSLKLAEVIAQGPEPFFRLMYRLDIPEKKLVKAMHDQNVVLEIAELVYNRQLQKMRSRQFYKNNKPDNGELSW